MEELLKQILNEINDMKRNMATKQDLTGLRETMTQEFKVVNDKIDQLAARGKRT